MPKKKFDTSDLLTGLTSPQDPVANEEQPSGVSSPRASSGGSRRGRKPMGAEEERISSIVNRELYSKCKAIAAIENIPIKSIMNKGMELAVAAYEEKHGPVKVKRTRKPGNISDIF